MPILQGFLSVKMLKTVFYTFTLKNGLLLRNTAIENWITANLTVALPSRKSWKGLPAFSFAKIRKESLCRKSHKQPLRQPPPQSRRPLSGKSAKPPMNYCYISVRQAQSAWVIKSCGYWKMTYPQRNDEIFSLCPWQTDRKGTLLPEIGSFLERKRYRIKCLNLINFKKSMRYNPLAYIRSEKDILKLVNALIWTQREKAKNLPKISGSVRLVRRR